MKSYKLLPYFLSLSFALTLSLSAFAQCPIAASCTPGNAPASAYAFGMGIYNVVVGSGANGFSNPTTNGVQDGYQDYSCSKKATVLEGLSTAISVTTNQNVNENVRVWLDLNNDGSFAATSELVFSSNNAKIHTGTFIVPISATVVKNTVLRMRVSADNFSSPLPTPCSTSAYSQVEDYGITVLPNTNKPAVDFSVSKPITCSPTVQFTNLVQNGATSYLWNFGDGTTSSAANPSHTYATTGTYPVKLKACNSNGCDSLTKTNYVTYHTNVPVAASCTPTTTSYCCGYGIIKATFGSMVNASQNGSAGYEDFTCTKSTIVDEGETYPVSLETNPANAQDTWIYIDYNNNGSFEASELVFTKLTGFNPSGTIQIATGRTHNTPLRMRLISDAIGTSSSPCISRTNGQVEDYTIIIRRRPSPRFSTNFSTNCDSIVQFTDASLFTPTSWLWDFGDGSPKSTQQNPQHKYVVAGTYSVKLTSCNADGCDSLTQNQLIHITKPCLPYCIPSNTNTQAWITNVKFNTINNSSGQDLYGYGNYTNLSSTIYKGTYHTFEINTNTTPANKMVSVWIDFNQDGDFIDNSEEVITRQTGAGNYVYSNILRRIYIPLTANSGPTRMRVATRSGTNLPLPCMSNQPDGEMEDYTINIQPNNLPPMAKFGSIKSSCNLFVQFQDTSANFPTSWLWNFGEPASGSANTSTLQNPNHTYKRTGTYFVTLKACNAFGCDSFPNYTYNITITDTLGPKGNQCVQTNYLSRIRSGGITRVKLNYLEYSSQNALEGAYMDRACMLYSPNFTDARTSLIIGNKHLMIVETDLQPSTSNENVRVWIDYDNNGIFDPTTELALSSDNKKRHIGYITPPLWAVTNKVLRMRVASDLSSYPIPQPCVNGLAGQAEDYGVTIIPNTFMPAVNFYVNNDSTCGPNINFTDTTNYAPISWAWNFGDPASGSGNTSALQNPAHSFSSPGTYTVTLTACNINGCSTIVKNNLIHVTDTIRVTPLCKPQTIGINGPYRAGITNVNFLTINNTTVPYVANGYKQYFCTSNAVTAPGTYPLTIRTGSSAPYQNVQVWIDFNNDGILSSSEQVMYSLNKLLHTASVTVPTTAVRNKWLLMRVMSEFTTNAIPQPCSNVIDGQVEDYAIKVLSLSGLPKDFFSSQLKIFPNPSTGTFSIQIPTVFKGSYDLEVQNLIGQTVAKQALKAETEQPQQINLKQLPKGIYLLKIFNENASAVKKIIIE